MRYMLPLACRCCFLSRTAKRGVIATQLPARCARDVCLTGEGGGRMVGAKIKLKPEISACCPRCGRGEEIGHDSASAVEIVGGQIEFAGVPLPVPQAAAGSVAHDDVSSCFRLQRGNLKIISTQQGPSWRVAARTGYDYSHPRGHPQAHNPAGASACIGIARF